MSKRNLAFEDMFHRLTYVHHACEEAEYCGTCKIGPNLCPYVIAGVPEHSVDDSFILKYQLPNYWTRGERREIARRLLHIE